MLIFSPGNNSIYSFLYHDFQGLILRFGTIFRCLRPSFVKSIINSERFPSYLKIFLLILGVSVAFNLPYSPLKDSPFFGCSLTSSSIFRVYDLLLCFFSVLPLLILSTRSFFISRILSFNCSQTSI